MRVLNELGRILGSVADASAKGAETVAQTAELGTNRLEAMIGDQQKKIEAEQALQPTVVDLHLLEYQEELGRRLSRINFKHVEAFQKFHETGKL